MATKTRLARAFPRKIPLRLAGEARRPSIACSDCSIANDRLRPSSPESEHHPENSRRQIDRRDRRRIPRVVEDHESEQREHERREKSAPRPELDREILARDEPRVAHHRGDILIIRPALSSPTCVATAIPSATLCVTTIIAAPAFRSSPSRVVSDREPSSSRPE